MIDRRKVRKIEGWLRYAFGNRRYGRDERRASFRQWAVLQVADGRPDDWAASWIIAGYEFPRAWMYPEVLRQRRIDRDRMISQAS